jgi:hypothetical protein
VCCTIVKLRSLGYIGNLKINLNLEKGYRQAKSCRLSSGLSIAGWWEGKDVA